MQVPWGLGVSLARGQQQFGMGVAYQVGYYRTIKPMKNNDKGTARDTQTALYSGPGGSPCRVLTTSYNVSAWLGVYCCKTACLGKSLNVRFFSQMLKTLLQAIFLIVAETPVHWAHFSLEF